MSRTEQALVARRKCRQPLELDPAVVARRLAKARRVVLFTGAGISAEVGICTFEDLERQDSKFRRDDAFSSSVWRDDVKGRRLLKMITKIQNQAISAQVTTFQTLLGRLAAQHKLIRHWTQNIDGIHVTPPGADERDAFGDLWTVELHGNVHQVSCETCGYNDDSLPGMFAHGRLEACPSCEEMAEKGIVRKSRSSGKALRPKVVLYGQEYSDVVMSQLEKDDCRDPDFLMVIGTTLRTDGAAKVLGDIAQRIQRRPEYDIIWVNPAPPPAGFLHDIWTGMLIGPVADLVANYVALDKGIGEGEDGTSDGETSGEESCAMSFPVVQDIERSAVSSAALDQCLMRRTREQKHSAVKEDSLLMLAPLLGPI